jgi:hypothetical protein
MPRSTVRMGIRRVGYSAHVAADNQAWPLIACLQHQSPALFPSQAKLPDGHNVRSPFGRRVDDTEILGAVSSDRHAPRSEVFESSFCLV